MLRRRPLFVVSHPSSRGVVPSCGNLLSFSQRSSNAAVSCLGVGTSLSGSWTQCRNYSSFRRVGPTSGSSVSSITSSDQCNFPGATVNTPLLGSGTAVHSQSLIFHQKKWFGKAKEGAGAGDSEHPEVSNWDVVRVVGRNLWPEGRWDLKARVCVSFSFVFATKLLKVSVPFWFKSIVDSLVPATAGTAAVTVGPFTLGIFCMVAAYGVTRLAACFTDELKTVIFTPVAANASNNIGLDIFKKLHNMDLTYHLSKQTGSLSKDLDRGSRAFSLVTFDIFFALAPAALEMSLVCYMLQRQAGINFVLTAFCAVSAYFLWTFCVTQWRAKFRHEYNEIDTNVSGMIIDSLMNYETVKYFNAEKYEANRVKEQYLLMNKAVLKLDWSMALMNFGQQAIFITAATAGLYFGTNSVLAGTMTVGDMVLVDALLLQLYQPLQFLGIIYRELSTSTQNMEKMLGLLKTNVKVQNLPDAKSLELSDGDIEFKNVTFGYDNRDILKDISFKIPGGTSAAFVGPSGSGKTSIFRLVFRFFDPTEGQVLVDGQDLKSVTLLSLRKHIGVVPQDTVMFNDTIKNNILYGNLEANDDEIKEAARQSSFSKSVEKFTDGYETVVGERGLMLSGGEKQRLAIARVFLKGSPILMADEATSALDSKTEAAVMDTLTAPSDVTGKRKTLLMIAHRLSTIQGADTIFVLDGKGALAEQGQHEELLERKGLYYQLWRRQLKEEYAESHAGEEPDAAILQSESEKLIDEAHQHRRHEPKTADDSADKSAVDSK